MGKHKNGMPANGPACDLNSAFSIAQSLGLTVPSMRTPWTGSVAVRCHPWWGMPSSMSTSRNCSGRAPAENSCQEGAWNPAGARCSPEARTPAERRVLFMEGVHERKRLGVSGGSSPNSLPSLPRKRVLRAKEHCGAQGRPDTVANWPDPSKCWQEQPREGG